MKKFLRILTAFVLAVFTTSCLDSNLEELPEFSDAEIVKIKDVYWRYYGTKTNPGSGEKEVRQAWINSGNWEIKSDKDGEAEAIFDIQFPGDFPSSQRNGEVTLEKLVVVFEISQGAIIRPIEGSAVLGVPGDWTKPNKYEVTAADGSKKIWTVSLDQIFNGSIVGL